MPRVRAMLLDALVRGGTWHLLTKPETPHPLDCTILSPSRSLANNALCGVHESGRGTYTAEGIYKLCEAIKASNTLTSLKCI